MVAVGCVCLFVCFGVVWCYFLLQAYIDRWRYNAKRAPQAQMKIKILEKLYVSVETIR